MFHWLPSFSLVLDWFSSRLLTFALVFFGFAFFLSLSFFVFQAQCPKRATFRYKGGTQGQSQPSSSPHHQFSNNHRHLPWHTFPSLAPGSTDETSSISPSPGRDHDAVIQPNAWLFEAAPQCFQSSKTFFKNHLSSSRKREPHNQADGTAIAIWLLKWVAQRGRAWNSFGPFG